MYFESSDLTAGQLNALVKKVGGKLGAERFLRGEFDIRCKNIPTWKTIVLEAGRVRKDYRELILKARRPTSYIANNMFALPDYEFCCVKEKTTIELIKISVREIGFFELPSYEDAFVRGVEIGLHLCPLETGPALFLENAESSKERERYMVATKPIGPYRSKYGGDSNYFGMQPEKIAGDSGEFQSWLTGASCSQSCASLKEWLVFAKHPLL